MRVSVVVCTRNGDAFVAEQLASVLAQTRLPSEIILSDDGSEDNTRIILRTFSETARKAGVDCHLIENSVPLGVTRNFEVACRRATGDVIFLADQDDRWHPGKIERLLSELAEPGVVLVASNARIITADGQPTGQSLFDRLGIKASELQQLAEGNLSHLLLYRTVITGATCAFKRSLLGVAMPFDDTLVHDEWLVQVAWLIGKVRVMLEPAMDYRLHASNTIGLDPQPIPGHLNTPNGRLQLHLKRLVAKLRPLVARFSELQGAPVIRERLVLRQRQLALATARLAYPSNFVRRAVRVTHVWRSGLYKADLSPGRTASLDFFRYAYTGTGA